MNIQLTPSTVTRFYKHVQLHTEPDGCDIWTGALDRYGYGKLRDTSHKSRVFKAHQIGYAIKHGTHDQALLRHKCNNPRCCNPDHLIPGSAKENAYDRVCRYKGVSHAE